MGINPEQLRDEIIVPTLNALGPSYSSPSAVMLLMGTAAQESHMGTYLRQLGGGPALGIYQMEPATHNDIIENWLRYREELVDTIAELIGPWNAMEPARMVYDLRYATIMARLHYRRVRDPLPADVDGQAYYWKTHYNTELGAGTREEYMHNYERYC